MNTQRQSYNHHPAQIENRRKKGIPLQSLELKITGEVQQVGYRRSVWRTANKIGVKGYVKNLPDGNVKIVAEGDAQTLQTFLKAIDIKEPPILVEKIKTREKKPTGRYRYFQIKTGPVTEELQEAIGTGEVQMNLFRNEFKDYRNEFRDYREEFRDYRKEFRRFAQRTDENFKLLEARYAEISEKLTEILQRLQKESVETRREMTRAVDNLTQLIQKIIQQQRVKQIV